MKEEIDELALEQGVFVNPTGAQQFRLHLIQVRVLDRIASALEGIIRYSEVVVTAPQGDKMPT